MPLKPIIGVDIGGTKILAVVADGNGKLLARKHIPTQPASGPEAGIKRIILAINQVCQQANISSKDGINGIGIAIAGLVDTPRGILVTSPHLPGWRDVPLKDHLEAALGVQVSIINDAKAAALGEQTFGAGKGVENQIYMTVSTGIGGGIIINGALYMGKAGSAGEIGHMVIDVNGPRCNCGNNGCLETLASGTAVAREVSDRLAKGASSTVRDMVSGRLQDITAEMVSKAAEQGDAVASEVIHQAGVYLGVGLANLVNVFNPELIIIGGGFAKVGSRLLDPAISEMKRRAFSRPANQVRITVAQLGDNSGALGAVAYLLNHAEGR
ncbi:MAG: ROK family protein [Dehalococcoidia bacterium]|nr:ROK family protein [Dehalococcoidia bacterium]